MPKKKLNLNKKAVKYALAVKEGRKKTEARAIAGYAPTTPSSRIEQTKDYLATVAQFKDELLAKMTMGEIADALIDNIRQEGETKKDRNARNRAVEIALNKIEPEEKTTTEERVVVVLSN